MWPIGEIQPWRCGDKDCRAMETRRSIIGGLEWSICNGISTTSDKFLEVTYRVFSLRRILGKYKQLEIEVSGSERRQEIVLYHVRRPESIQCHSHVQRDRIELPVCSWAGINDDNGRTRVSESQSLSFDGS
jgi:hypothetical protein